MDITIGGGILTSGCLGAVDCLSKLVALHHKDDKSD